MTEWSTTKRRRSFGKLYDTPDGNFTINFPKFVTSLQVVALHHQTDSVAELVKILQNMCIAEGCRPHWKPWQMGEAMEDQQEKKRAENAQRMRDLNERKAREKEALGGQFQDRAVVARETMGDK